MKIFGASTEAQKKRLAPIIGKRIWAAMDRKTLVSGMTAEEMTAALGELNKWK